MKRLLALLIVFSLGIAQQSHGDSIVNTLTVNQWVQPTESGVLRGRIVIPAESGSTKAVEGAVVSVIDADGKVLKSNGKTNSKGEFVIKSVKPGVYALTARADYVFAACAMHVLDSDLVGEQEFPHLAEICAANIDFTMVKTAVIRYLPPKSKKMSRASLDAAQLDSLANQVCGEKSFRVAQVNGGLKGRLHSAGAKGGNLGSAQLTNVFIIKNGIEVARTITNENGEFEINRIGAGNYSMMAVGPDGLGLIGFELVDEEEIETQTVQVGSNGQTLVGLVDGGCCCGELAMQVAPMPEIVVEQPAIVEAPMIDSCGGCGEVVSNCGCDCGVPVDPCGCGGVVEGEIIEGEIIGGEIIDGEIIDGDFAGGGVLVDDLGSPVAGGGFGGGGGYNAGGGGGFLGGGGGGLLGGGGIGALAGLAGIGGLIAATVSDDDNGNAVVAPPIVSVALPN